MNKAEQVRYLANLYYLLASDGAVDRVEEKVFEEIARDIGAGYFERREAMEMAKKEGLQVRLGGRLSERIRNLEDMLFLAYCDGALAPAEKKPIMDYAKTADEWRESEWWKWSNRKKQFWNMAKNVAGEPSPGKAGTKVKMTVEGVKPGTAHFAVRSFDDSHNRSAPSNVVSAEVK